MNRQPLVDPDSRSWPMLGREAWIALALCLAIKIKLFDHVQACADRSRALTISGMDAKRTIMIAEAMVGAGYLFKGEDDIYRNTPRGQQFFMSESPDFVGDYVRLMPYQFERYKAFAEGDPFVEGFCETLFAESPQYVADYHKAMACLAVPAARMFASMAREEHVFGQSLKSVIDLGCGPALQSRAFAEAINARLTLVDCPDVINALMQSSLWPESTKQSADFISSDIFDVEGEHDVAIMANVIHYYDNERLSRLLRHIRENILVDGGTLIIQDFGFANLGEQDYVSAFQTEFAVYMLLHSGPDCPFARSYTQINELVHGAGGSGKYLWLDVHAPNTYFPSYISCWRSYK